MFRVQSIQFLTIRAALLTLCLRKCQCHRLLLGMTMLDLFLVLRSGITWSVILLVNIMMMRVAVDLLAAALMLVRLMSFWMGCVLVAWISALVGVGIV